MWDDTVHYDAHGRKDKSSINHCRKSVYRFFIHYVDGSDYKFEQFINRDNAVRMKNYIINLISLATTYKYFKRRRNGKYSFIS